MCKDRFSEYFMYDEASPSLLINLTNRGSARAGQPSGASSNNEGYLQTKLNGKEYKTHRIIWELHYGEIQVGQEIDHINGARHDNRIANLRLATRSQNNQNRSKHKNGNRNLPKGIMAHRQVKNYYIARITVDGITYSKSSADVDVLTDWIIKKRKELHGEFGKTY